MNHLDFNIYQDENGHHKTQILIDGEDLRFILKAENYLELHPLLLSYNLNKQEDYFEMFAFLNREENTKTVLYNCSCNIFQCDLIYVDEIIDQGAVIWNNIKARKGITTTQIYPFKFSKKNYLDCLNSLRTKSDSI